MVKKVAKVSWIMVEFDCHRCGLLHYPVAVPARLPTEDVVSWMNTAVRPRIAIAHRLNSPICPSEECDLKIPISKNAEFIGQPPTQN